MKRYGLQRSGPPTHEYHPYLVPSLGGRWVCYEDIQAMVKNAQKVVRLLELGDQRLLAGDGPCGGQNAAVALSSEETAKLYQACKKIAAEGVSYG